jgi:excisionase family DNA binding protein
MNGGTVTPGRPQKRLYSLKEAAQYLGRTERALRHLVDRGKIPTVRIDSRIQFAIEDMNRLIDQHRETYID